MKLWGNSRKGKGSRDGAPRHAADQRSAPKHAAPEEKKAPQVQKILENNTSRKEKGEERARKPKLREVRGNRNSKKLFHPVLVFFLCLLVVLVALGAFCKVSRFTVEGNSLYSDEEIVAATKIQIGDSLFFIDKSQTAANLMTQLPYIQSVAISKKIPDQVIITVEESQRLAYLQSGEDFWILDSSGRVIDKLTEADLNSQIKVNGLTFEAPTIGTDLTVSGDQQGKLDYLCEILKEIQDRNLQQSVTYIDVSDPANPTFDFNRQFVVRMGPKSNTANKFSLLQSVVERIGERQYGVIDLSTDGEAHYTPN